jgi:hypothetical protein
MPKKAISLRIDEELLERAQNAAWHVGRGLNLTGMIEEGLAPVVSKLEKKHNEGKPFPARKKD